MPLNVKLLRRVQKHILKEPSRLMMSDWIIQKTPDCLKFYNDDDKLVSFPKCNTAACIAGWAVMLHDKHPPERESVQTRAVKILGLAGGGDSLFLSSYWVHADQYLRAKTPLQRAKIAAKEIDLYIKEYGPKK